jgi:superfamily II RNA helicase
MAGRAGRRGKDDKGIVVYLPMRDPEPVLFVEEMMTGKQSTVVSRMDFHYSFVLTELQSKKSIQGETYWAFQRKNKCNNLKRKF